MFNVAAHYIAGRNLRFKECFVGMQVLVDTKIEGLLQLQERLLVFSILPCVSAESRYVLTSGSATCISLGTSSFLSP